MSVIARSAADRAPPAQKACRASRPSHSTTAIVSAIGTPTSNIASGTLHAAASNRNASISTICQRHGSTGVATLTVPPIPAGRTAAAGRMGVRPPPR